MYNPIQEYMFRLQYEGDSLHQVMYEQISGALQYLTIIFMTGITFISYVLIMQM